MRPVTCSLGAFSLVIAMLTGCSTAPTTSDARSRLHDDAQAAIARMKAEDPNIQRFFDNSIAYAVFPSVGKGGLGVGGAYGRGVLYEGGRPTGYCDLTQGSVGLQIGGQAYTEIIFFQNRRSLDDFKNNSLELAAQASAVAVRRGAAANANYENGVAVFTHGHEGLMAEASVGGQRFTVVTDPEAPRTASSNRDYEVYGYARDDEASAAWRNGSSYNQLYDTRLMETISGEITSIGQFSPATDSIKGQMMTVRSSDGRTYTVHLGPSGYMERRGDTLRLRVGDYVTVTGSLIKYEGNQTLLAREIRGGTNQVLLLRDNDGRVRWD